MDVSVGAGVGVEGFSQRGGRLSSRGRQSRRHRPGAWAGMVVPEKWGCRSRPHFNFVYESYPDKRCESTCLSSWQRATPAPRAVHHSESYARSSIQRQVRGTTVSGVLKAGRKNWGRVRPGQRVGRKCRPWSWRPLKGGPRPGRLRSTPGSEDILRISPRLRLWQRGGPSRAGRWCGSSRRGWRW